MGTLVPAWNVFSEVPPSWALPSEGLIVKRHQRESTKAQYEAARNARAAAEAKRVDYVKDGFTVPLTRKMCHEVVAATAEHSLLAAMRRVQVDFIARKIRRFR